MRVSLAKLSNSQRITRWAALLACMALLFVGVAHAGHLHKNSASKVGTEHALCGLCIQFDRLAGAPTTGASPQPSATFSRVLLSPATAAQLSLLSHSYDARGPPA